MKKIAIGFLFLSFTTASMAQIAINKKASQQQIQQEQTYLGPINPGNADNY